MQQPSWSSTPNSVYLGATDAFARNLMHKYGGRTDAVSNYWDMEGYKRTLGSPSSAPGGGWSYNTGSGGVTLKGIGRGNTPSDPGGYNYGTLSNTISNTFRGEKSIYGSYRGKQQQVQQQQKVSAIKAARQQKSQQQAQQQAQQAQLNTFAGNTFATSMGLRAGVQAGKSALKPGASSPMPRGGTPAPGPVNLLKGPTALGQPAKKPRAARSTIQKPKATRPATPNTFDPSIW